MKDIISSWISFQHSHHLGPHFMRNSNHVAILEASGSVCLYEADWRQGHLCRCNSWILGLKVLVFLQQIWLRKTKWTYAQESAAGCRPGTEIFGFGWKWYDRINNSSIQSSSAPHSTLLLWYIDLCTIFQKAVGLIYVATVVIDDLSPHQCHIVKPDIYHIKRERVYHTIALHSIYLIFQQIS